MGGSAAPEMPGTPTLTLAKVTVPLHSPAVVSGNWSHLTGEGGQFRPMMTWDPARLEPESSLIQRGGKQRPWRRRGPQAGSLAS